MYIKLLDEQRVLLDHHHHNYQMYLPVLEIRYRYFKPEFFHLFREPSIFSEVLLQPIGPIFKSQEVYLLDFLTLEDGTDTLSRNVGTELRLNPA
jgi:hypothetical protein